MLVLMGVCEKFYLPVGKQDVLGKWVFEYKCNMNRVVFKNEAQFMVQGTSKRASIFKKTSNQQQGLCL